MARDSLYPSSVKAGKPNISPLPSGWEQATLDKYLQVENRRAKLTDDQEYDLVTVKRSRGGVVRREHLKGRDIAVKSQFYIQEGDFLISKRQIVHGACGMVPKDLSGSIVSNEYCVITGKSNFHLPFIEYLSESLYFQQTCFHSSIGVHIEKMIFKLESWFKWPFNIPPLIEQKKITQILSTWDKAITTTEQLLTNSQQQRKSLMQKLLTGKERLLDKNGIRFNGEFKRFHFSDLLEIDRKSLGSKTDPNLEFDYISLSDVGTGTISRAPERHIFKKSPSRARRIVSPGDILFATVRPNLQGFAKVKEQHEHCIASTGFAVLTPKKGTCGDYVYHYLFGSHITGQINALVVGTNYPAINSSDVSGLCIYCPHYEEQIEISKVLNSSDELIYALQKKLDTLKQERKALMQQLLTGKRRVQIN